MEALVFISFVFVGIFIYRSFPSSKYKRAKALVSAGSYVKAIKIYESIFESHPDAPGGMAEAKFKQGLAYVPKDLVLAKAIFNDVILLRKRLVNKSNRKLYEVFEASSYFENSRINFNDLQSYNEGDRISLLEDNIRYLDSAFKFGMEKEFADLRIMQIFELANLCYHLAKEFEKKMSFKDATEFYLRAKKLAYESTNTQIHVNASARIGICKLKTGVPVDKSTFKDVVKSSKDIQSDFYLRYVKFLLLSGKFNEAEAVVSQHLSSKSKQVLKLQEYFHAKNVKSASDQLNDINSDLEKLHAGGLSIDGLELLLNKVDNQIHLSKTLLLGIGEKLQLIKVDLLNRLLIQYLNLKQFDNGLSIANKYPEFWRDYDVLKTLGICCLGIVKDGVIREENYKIVISTWLSVVFSDRIIINSLENTSWDDDYTFTLLDSIGSGYDIYENLPDNVNYEEITDRNISIGSTQRELLNQFELLLYEKVKSADLSDLIFTFYTAQKVALQEVVEVIAEDIFMPAPYFATRYGINHTIINALNDDYQCYSDEKALEAGLPYVTGPSDTYVNDYSVAVGFIDEVKTAIVNRSLSQLNTMNSDPRKRHINKFARLATRAEDTLVNAFVPQIDSDDEKLISMMEEGINLLAVNSKLKYQYSNHLMSYCIRNVNEKRINNFNALSLIKKAYLTSPEHPKVCKNLVTLIGFNLMDVLNDQTKNQRSIYKLLDEIHVQKSDAYMEASFELGKTRQSLLNELEQAGVDISVYEAGQQIRYPSNLPLNENGLRILAVLTYFAKMS